MRVAILKNRSRVNFRQFGKRLSVFAYEAIHKGSYRGLVLPEYDSFANILDESPIIIGTDDLLNWNSLSKADLLIWEWGWTATPAKTMLEIKDRLNIPVLMFPGPFDRFWRELSDVDIEIQLEAVKASNSIGVMLQDTFSLYKSLSPLSHVFHMPVPVDIDTLRAYSLPQNKRDKNKILLTAPTKFTGLSSQLPIATFLAFKDLVKKNKSLKGICFVYNNNEREGVSKVLNYLGISDKVNIFYYLRPIQRYLREIASCWAGISLPYSMLQGRNAMTSACLGIPMVVSEEIETHRFLFPHTSVRWHNTSEAFSLIDRLISDNLFRNKVIDRSIQQIEYYSLEKCKERMLMGVNASALITKEGSIR
jgi:hypothetical protein